MKFKEVALEVYQNENSKLTFNQWLEVRINEGRITMEQALECGYVKEEENDFSYLVAELSKIFPMSYIRKLVTHLSKKQIGKVEKFTLELSGKNLVGIVVSDKGEFKIWNTTCQTSNGKQHTRLVISELGGKENV